MRDPKRNSEIRSHEEEIVSSAEKNCDILVTANTYAPKQNFIVLLRPKVQFD